MTLGLGSKLDLSLQIADCLKGKSNEFASCQLTTTFQRIHLLAFVMIMAFLLNLNSFIGSEGIKNQQAKRMYKLPSYFDYELYKQIYAKETDWKRPKIDEEIRRRIYLRTALEVFKQRALFRAGRQAKIQSTNEKSDWVSRSHYVT